MFKNEYCLYMRANISSKLDFVDGIAILHNLFNLSTSYGLLNCLGYVFWLFYFFSEFKLKKIILFKSSQLPGSLEMLCICVYG